MSMTVIEHIEVASSQASVTTSAISSDFTDLLVVCSIRSDSTSNANRILYQFNSNSANYSARYLQGSGSGVNSSTGLSTANILGFVPESGYTSSTFGTYSLYVPNYAGSEAKSSSADGASENNATEARATIAANLWNDTSAITSITFSLEAGSIVQYSSFTIFGITAGSDGTTTVS